MEAGRGADGCGCSDAIGSGLVRFREPKVEVSSGSRKNLASRGDSGEKEGKEVSDLSDAAIEEAELDGCEISFLRWWRTVPDRWLLIEAPDCDCCETERSSGAEEVAVVSSIFATVQPSSYPTLLNTVRVTDR